MSDYYLTAEPVGCCSCHSCTCDGCPACRQDEDAPRITVGSVVDYDPWAGVA